LIGVFFRLSLFEQSNCHTKTSEVQLSFAYRITFVVTLGCRYISLQPNYNKRNAMRAFTVTIRTSTTTHTYPAIATSPAAAHVAAEATQGDEPFGITVLPAGGQQ
jgi:hypothetical protein